MKTMVWDEVARIPDTGIRAVDAAEQFARDWWSAPRRIAQVQNGESWDVIVFTLENGTSQHRTRYDDNGDWWVIERN